MTGESALALKDLRFSWPGAAGFALEVDAFALPKGERTLLLGASGSGKSTLLSLICGISTPDAGSVEVDGTDIARLSRRRRDRFRAENIGIVFQQFNLLAYVTALDNALLPLRFAPRRRARIGDERAEVLRLAAALGLDAAQMKKGGAGLLSVGQQQRVAVVRALIGSPALIVADEPTSALDASAQAAFVDTLFTHVEAAGASLLMVSHDERLAGRFDRAVRIDDIARIERAVAA
ncbi:MAG: ATP-binding cassette domain-containing protein [Pseudomonadota bacterium]